VAISHYEVQVDQYVPGEKTWRYVSLKTNDMSEAVERMLSYRDIMITEHTRLEGSTIGRMHEVTAFGDTYVTENKYDDNYVTFVTVLRIFTE
jgi:hypothetical protein